MAIDPIQWAKGTTANPRGRLLDCIDYLDYELQAAKGPHQSCIDRWIRWLELYRAPIDQPVRNWPYERAANFMLPMAAIDVDQMYAKFMQTIHAADNVWTLEPLNERWVNAAKPLQDFLTWLDSSILHMYRVNKRVVMEHTKLGTGIYKHGWTAERRPVWVYEDGRRVKAERLIGKPFVDHVPLSRFMVPSDSYSIDPDEQGGAAWVSQLLRIPTARLKSMADGDSPLLPKIDREALEAILRHEEPNSTDYDAAVQRLDYEQKAFGGGVQFDNEQAPAKVSGGLPASPRMVREIELHEIHLRFPTQTNNSEDDCILWYHEPTRRIVRGVYNYYQHGKRPFEVIRYFPGDGFYGIGVCEQAEIFQLMQSDIHNFTWDNALLANSRMFVARRGSGIQPGEPIFPGKIFFTDNDVRQDFGSFQMNDINPSLPALQQFIQFMKDKRTGVGDLQSGQMQNLPSRTPATTTMSLLQEGNRRPDFTIKDMRYEGLSAVGLRTLQNCQQFMGQGTTMDVGGKELLALSLQVLGMPEGVDAAEKLAIPLESIENGIGVSISATSGTSNAEVQRQNYLALLQLSGQISQQLVQFATVAMQAQGTPIAAMAESAIGAILELSKRLLEQYDIRNIDAIIPVPSMAPAPQAPLAAPGVPQGPGGPAGPPAVPNGAQPGPGGGAPLPPLDASLSALFGGTVSGL